MNTQSNLHQRQWRIDLFGGSQGQHMVPGQSQQLPLSETMSHKTGMGRPSVVSTASGPAEDRIAAGGGSAHRWGCSAAINKWKRPLLKGTEERWNLITAMRNWTCQAKLSHRFVSALLAWEHHYCQQARGRIFPASEGVKDLVEERSSPVNKTPFLQL